MAEKRDVPIKLPDSILPGVYANQMMVTHTREEFLLDYINLFPPSGVVNARVLAEVAQEIAACHAKPAPNAADPPSHLPLLPRCCDDRMNLPNTAASSSSG